jgi:hypothetical protein
MPSQPECRFGENVALDLIGAGIDRSGALITVGVYSGVGAQPFADVGDLRRLVAQQLGKLINWKRPYEIKALQFVAGVQTQMFYLFLGFHAMGLCVSRHLRASRARVGN